MTLRAICVVIMPFGRKLDAGDQSINFDAIYQSIIAPAINEVELVGIRADEEMSSGFIHKLMYERLILSEFAITDLTVLNANVYYELCIRHAARPSSTCRDPSPGVNALTVMVLANPDDPEILELLPVVRYAAERRIATSTAEYWDHAALLELSVIQNSLEKAEDILPDVLALLRERWEAETTAHNLSLIANARLENGHDVKRIVALFAEIRNGSESSALERLANG